jgi:hypothetical protein
MAGFSLDLAGGFSGNCYAMIKKDGGLKKTIVGNMVWGVDMNIQISIGGFFIRPFLTFFTGYIGTVGGVFV